MLVLFKSQVQIANKLGGIGALKVKTKPTLSYLATGQGHSDLSGDILHEQGRHKTGHRGGNQLLGHPQSQLVGGDKVIHLVQGGTAEGLLLVLG